MPDHIEEIPEEEKIIICSLVSAGASCESAAAGYRLMGDTGAAKRCEADARRLKAEAERVLDGREM